jgi:SAM-dependent methyltransferase
MELPFESNRFDLVFCRFLLEYFPDKESAVREICRVCRNGGTVLLQDLDGQLLWHFPEDAELQQTTERVVTYLQNTGLIPLLGESSSTCSDVSVQVDPYHLYAGRIDEKHLNAAGRDNNEADLGALNHLQAVTGRIDRDTDHNTGVAKGSRFALHRTTGRLDRGNGLRHVLHIEDQVRNWIL